MSTDKALGDVRQQIDAIDEQIQALITQRANCALEVARVKREQGEPEEGFFRPEREVEVLRRVKQRNRELDSPLADDDMARVFRELMSMCLALQLPIKVAFLGPAGTFTQDAAHKHFGRSIVTVPLGAIDEIFREVESGAAHFGVVPVENSTEGVITYTLDMFSRSDLRVCGEVDLRIHHHLLSKDAGKDVQRVYAHPQALAQCREWLDSNMPAVERVAVSSNAEGARRAAEEDGAAAVASETAGALYGLKVCCRNIEDESDNTTRFLVIGRESCGPTGNDRTSLLVVGRNRPGMLHSLLGPFQRHGISMTRIESRPSRTRLWDYMFFIDIEGHEQDKSVAAALVAMRVEAAVVKVLGSYPKAEL